MAYFKNKEKYIPKPIPPIPPYVPPVVPTPPTPEEGSTPTIDPLVFTGSYTLELYNNLSDSSVYRKELQSLGSIVITLKDSVSIIDPVIIIDSTSDLSKVNYFKLGNYYYYGEVSLISGNIYRIDGHMDGLMSCDLSGCACSVSKSASNYDNYLADNIPCASYIQTKTLKFSQGFNKNLKYLLITVGGDNNA